MRNMFTIGHIVNSLVSIIYESRIGGGVYSGVFLGDRGGGGGVAPAGISLLGWPTD